MSTATRKQDGELLAHTAPPRSGWFGHADFLYAMCLFAAGAAVLVTAGITGDDAWLPDASPWLPVFFLAYGLFTIQIGYTHPRVGYVSFDRVAQVASILVLGPIAAAWINGLASLLWPLQRLREGKPLREVIAASLHNAGLMTLMIVGCGRLYVLLAGPVPLSQLDAGTFVAVMVLILSMQFVNELLMTTQLRVSGSEFRWHLQGFALAMEIGSALAGVLVAIAINRLELPVVVLALMVLALGMIALNQFARMRNRLEAIVDERTRVLHAKTLELEQLATRDQLTGLFNRRHADDNLRRCIEEFGSSGRDFSIALIDLDHFKSINDWHSHETGDEVLRRVARLLAGACRETDILARYGGEEFLVCFPDTSVMDAAGICEQLRSAVETADWSALAPDIRVTLSAGVAGMQSGLTRSVLLNKADARLYRAKHEGRNRVVPA